MYVASCEKWTIATHGNNYELANWLAVMRRSPVRSFQGLITLVVRRSWNSCGGLTSGVARLAQRDIPRITPTNSALPFHLHASRRRDGVSPPHFRISYPVDASCHPYEATPPITKITPVADLVFCADSRWRPREGATEPRGWARSRERVRGVGWGRK